MINGDDNSNRTERLSFSTTEQASAVDVRRVDVDVPYWAIVVNRAHWLGTERMEKTAVLLGGWSGNSILLTTRCWAVTLATGWKIGVRAVWYPTSISGLRYPACLCRRTTTAGG